MSAREPTRPPVPPEAARRGPPAGGGEREYDLLLREAPRGISVAQGVLGILVRLLGVGLLIVGLVAAVAVLVEAWKLYQAPERMERFAVAVEQGSNLDKIFAIPAGGGQEAEAQESPAATGQHLRLSYFVAWFVVLLMLLIVSIIALSTVSAGGRLALYDTDVRQLSKAVVREVRRRK